MWCTDAAKQTVCGWAVGTIIGDLRTRKTGVNHNQPLGAGTVVALHTAGDSLIVAQVDIIKPVADAKAVFSMEGKTNLLNAAASSSFGAGL